MLIAKKNENHTVGGNATSETQEKASAATTESENRPVDGSAAGRRKTIHQSNGKSFSNPAVLSSFVIGLAALLAIGITGCCVLQRQQLY